MSNMQPIAKIPKMARVIRPNTCKNCKWGEPQAGQPNIVCHRLPPVATSLLNPRNGAIANATAFPIVGPDNWCGEWGPKVEGLN